MYIEFYSKKNGNRACLDIYFVPIGWQDTASATAEGWLSVDNDKM